MEPTSDVYVLDQNPRIGRRNSVAFPLVLHFTLAGTDALLGQHKEVNMGDRQVTTLQGCCSSKEFCCTGPVWGQPWKIECQIRFILWMRLLINFALRIQVQRRWDRADSQMGRLRSWLLSLNGCQFSHWPPFCAFCCRRDPKPWKVISGSPQHLWVSEVKVVSLMQGKTGATGLHLLQQQGWCALGNTEPASRENREFPMQEWVLYSLSPYSSLRWVILPIPEEMGLPDPLLPPKAGSIFWNKVQGDDSL